MRRATKVLGLPSGAAGESARVGALGSGAHARVDGLGSIRPDRSDWWLEWWVGADDRWHVPAHEVAVRSRLVRGLPVVETAMRVPGGDAVQRVYGVGGPNAALVVEVENASPAPFVVALVARGLRRLEPVTASDADGHALVLDGHARLVTHRRPSGWADAVDGTLQLRVTGGSARAGEVDRRLDRAGRIDAAFLFPVAHRATLRAALLLRPAPIPFGAGALRALPGPDHVARGWSAQLDRGTRLELPDDAIAAAWISARAQLLLEADAGASSPATHAALVAWGLEDHAERRRPSRAGARWSKHGAVTRAPAGGSSWDAVRRLEPTGGSRFLLALRDALVAEHTAGNLTVLGELPPEWRGLPLEVHELTTRLGPLSFAVRWHGARPALLWDVPGGARVRAPGLDPWWCSDLPRGEALLAGPAGSNP